MMPPPQTTSNTDDVGSKKLIILGIPASKTQEDVTRYAWSVTQHYPKSVLPSSEYQNGWLVEFAVGMGKI